MGESWIKNASLVFAIVMTLVAGSMRFQSVETRVAQLEAIQVVTQSKLDNMMASLSRIEGQLAERQALREQRSK